MKTRDPIGQPGSILLVEDDPDAGEGLCQLLRLRGGFEVVREHDAEGALSRIGSGQQWDLLITDIELPGMSGLELLERARQLMPGLPVAVMTGFPSVDYAVSALRGSAAEFLQKPVRAADLIAKAATLIQAGRADRAAGRERVLAVGAHPDDVEISAAGTLLAHSGAGDTVAILTLTRGARGGDQAQRARESQQAADLIGARLFLDDLDDTHIAEGNPTIDIIEQVVAEIRPTVVYTHSLHDVHQDHRNTHRAAMVACRRVGRVYCFQSPSATIDYRPAHFVTIDDYISRKLKVIGAFGSQATRDYLEPELITSTARYWSRYCDGTHAEPFEAVRDRGVPVPSPGGERLAVSP